MPASESASMSFEYAKNEILIQLKPHTVQSTVIHFTRCTVCNVQRKKYCIKIFCLCSTMNTDKKLFMVFYDILKPSNNSMFIN